MQSTFCDLAGLGVAWAASLSAPPLTRRRAGSARARHPARPGARTHPPRRRRRGPPSSSVTAPAARSPRAIWSPSPRIARAAAISVAPGRAALPRRRAALLAARAPARRRLDRRPRPAPRRSARRARARRRRPLGRRAGGLPHGRGDRAPPACSASPSRSSRPRPPVGRRPPSRQPELDAVAAADPRRPGRRDRFGIPQPGPVPRGRRPRRPPPDHRSRRRRRRRARLARGPPGRRVRRATVRRASRRHTALAYLRPAAPSSRPPPLPGP